MNKITFISSKKRREICVDVMQPRFSKPTAWVLILSPVGPTHGRIWIRLAT